MLDFLYMRANHPTGVGGGSVGGHVSCVVGREHCG